MRQALDPGWVSKTIAKALLLAVPAVVLLARTYWNPKKKNPEAGSPFAFWVGISIVIAYCLWILDWVFQWSILFGVGAPLLGALFSMLGIGLSFAAPRGDRVKLAVAN